MYKVGDKIEAKVLSINSSDKKISLGIKQLTNNPWSDIEDKYKVGDKSKGIVKNIDREWKRRDHALFVGYAPVEDPKYAISVVVEHGGSGSGIAAPIARDIFMKLFNI